MDLSFFSNALSQVGGLGVESPGTLSFFGKRLEFEASFYSFSDDCAFIGGECFRQDFDI